MEVAFASILLFMDLNFYSGELDALPGSGTFLIGESETMVFK
jgi:hypothetical protein